MRKLWVCLLVPALLAGCAKPPRSGPELTAYASGTDSLTTSAISAVPAQPATTEQAMPARLVPASLAGRTMSVSSADGIVLEPGEVVLTFDDGPRPGRTEAILDVLDAFDARATFLMLGQAAQTHPELVRAVARRGHTIGTHTFHHTDLTTLSLASAMAEMQSGYDAVADALSTVGLAPSRFFRFPYLAQTGLIRAGAIESDFIVLDVDVDSKDYYTEAPHAVLARTLDRLDAQGQGVILFHDIHRRTVVMLPGFLEALAARGYSVVTLRSAPDSAFDDEIITASAPGGSTPL